MTLFLLDKNVNVKKMMMNSNYFKKLTKRKSINVDETKGTTMEDFEN